MKLVKIFLAGALVLGASGCESNSMGRKETIGAVVGGVTGAVIGAQFGAGAGQLAATAVGTMAGAFIGKEVGKSMDDNDRRQANSATNRALNNGRPAHWQNPNTGAKGEIIVRPTSAQAKGQTCRNFTHTVIVDGKREQLSGLACRQGNGAWKVVGA